MIILLLLLLLMLLLMWAKSRFMNPRNPPNKLGFLNEVSMWLCTRFRGHLIMSPIKQRLLEAIEQTPESILEQTLTFLEFLISRTPAAGIAPDLDSDFDSDTDSNDKILADLKASLHQAKAGQTFPIEELWDGINV